MTFHIAFVLLFVSLFVLCESRSRNYNLHELRGRRDVNITAETTETIVSAATIPVDLEGVEKVNKANSTVNTLKVSPVNVQTKKEEKIIIITAKGKHEIPAGVPELVDLIIPIRTSQNHREVMTSTETVAKPDSVRIIVPLLKGTDDPEEPLPQIQVVESSIIPQIQISVPKRRLNITENKLADLEEIAKMQKMLTTVMEETTTHTPEVATNLGL